MAIIDDIIAEDAKLAFSQVDFTPGTETATYTPRVGSTRSIRVNINRGPLRAPPETTAHLVEAMEVWIPNSATFGITPAELNRGGGDTLTIAYVKGGTAKAYLLGSPVSQDSGGMMFLIGSTRS